MIVSIYMGALHQGKGHEKGHMARPISDVWHSTLFFNPLSTFITYTHTLVRASISGFQPAGSTKTCQQNKQIDIKMCEWPEGE